MSFDFSFTPSRGPSKAAAARLGHEAVTICARGDYVTKSGRRVSIADDVARAIEGTVEHLPSEIAASSTTHDSRSQTRTSVVNGTSLASGHAFARRGVVPAILNFASARNPGGGFLNGARAQEESLCRASALYPCLIGSKRRGMYEHHAHARDPIYASFVIYSPRVPVFIDDSRGEGDELLEEPWQASFITSPAPNAGVVLQRDPDRGDDVRRALIERAARVLSVAAHHGDRHLVLGAWGCGVFGNDPNVVARVFRDAIDGPFKGVFDEIVFAVVDWSPERRTIRPFVELFHG